MKKTVMTSEAEAVVVKDQDDATASAPTSVNESSTSSLVDEADSTANREELAAPVVRSLPPTAAPDTEMALQTGKTNGTQEDKEDEKMPSIEDVSSTVDTPQQDEKIKEEAAFSHLEAAHAMAASEAVAIALDEEVKVDEETENQLMREKEESLKEGSTAVGAVAVAAVPLKNNDKEKDLEANDEKEKEGATIAAVGQRNGMDDDSVVPPPPLSRMEELSRQTSTPGAYAVPGSEELSSSEPQGRQLNSVVASDRPLVSAELVDDSNNNQDSTVPATSGSSHHDPSSANGIVTVEASPMDEKDEKGALMAFVSSKRGRIILGVVAVVFVGLIVVIVLAVSGQIGSNSKAPVIEISDGSADGSSGDPTAFVDTPAPSISPVATNEPTNAPVAQAQNKVNTPAPSLRPTGVTSSTPPTKDNEIVNVFSLRRTSSSQE